MAAKTKKAKTSSTSSSKAAAAKKKPAAKAKPAKATAKTAPAPKKPSKAAPAKSTAKAKIADKKTTTKAAAPKTSTASKIKASKSGLSQEVSKKAKVAPKPKDDRRSQAAALIEAAMEDDEDEDDDDEFDPEAFLAASGGKGLINAHVMRKERVDLNLPIRYRQMRGPLVYNSILLNLSKSGLCLETKEDYEPKTVLRIEIPLPHTSELFAIQAEVIWSDKSPDSPAGKNATYHIGMNFLPMSLAKKTVINNFIQQRRDEIVMAKIGLDRFGESVPVSGLD